MAIMSMDGHQMMRTTGYHIDVKQNHIKEFHEKINGESLRIGQAPYAHARTERDIDEVLVEHLDDALYAIFAHQLGKFPDEINVLNCSKYDTDGKRIGEPEIKVIIGSVEMASDEDELEDLPMNLLSAKLTEEYKSNAHLFVSNFNKWVLFRKRDIELIEQVLFKKMGEPEHISSNLVEMVYHVLYDIDCAVIDEEHHYA